MAKARPIHGLHAGLPFAEAAARTVEVRVAELEEHSDGVLDTDDVERVHAMRVATRRLRAVLEIYRACFPAEQLDPALREVKALADALGERRDPDVQLLALRRLAEDLDERDRPGVQRLADDVRLAQQEGNERLAAALTHAQDEDLMSRLKALSGSAR